MVRQVQSSPTLKMNTTMNNMCNDLEFLSSTALSIWVNQFKNRYWEQRLNCFYNLCVHLCQNKMYVYIYTYTMCIQDTIYFTCINVEES